MTTRLALCAVFLFALSGCRKAKPEPGSYEACIAQATAEAEAMNADLCIVLDTDIDAKGPGSLPACLERPRKRPMLAVFCVGYQYRFYDAEEAP